MRPIGNIIIVRQLPPEVTSTVIIAPEHIMSKPYAGEVVFAGDKAESRPGDTVAFDKWAYIKIEYNSEELLMIQEENASVIFTNNNIKTS
jgi:co-chaperonin GroES (HSP10)